MSLHSPLGFYKYNSIDKDERVRIGRFVFDMAEVRGMFEYLRYWLLKYEGFAD